MEGSGGGVALSQQERAALAVAARQRMYRGGVVLAVFGVLATAGMIGYVLTLRADLPPDRDAGRLWIVGSLVVVLVMLTFTVPLIALRRRARDPELLLGAQRGTRKAVRHALRDGHTADPRIDALAREAAHHQMRLLRGRRRYLPWLFCVAAVLYLAGAVALLVDDRSTLVVVSLALGAVSLGLSGTHLFLSVRRCRRYLANHSHTGDSTHGAHSDRA